VAGKGGGRVNTMQILCAHVCKCKNETCCNYSRNGGGGIKERSGQVNLSMIFLTHCKNFCKCYNVSPTQHNNKINTQKKKKERKKSLMTDKVVHTCSSSYLGAKDWEDHGWRPACAKSYKTPFSINKPGRVVCTYNGRQQIELRAPGKNTSDSTQK
jgi:hypothetical protein